MCSERDEKLQPGPRGESVIPAGDAPCIWMGAGLISFRLCDRNFDCETCPLDASLRPASGGDSGAGMGPCAAAPAPRRTEPAAPSGGASAPHHVLAALLDLRLPDPPGDRFYHPGHTWVRMEDDGTARIGIDAFAAAILGRVRSIVAPHAGTVLRRGRPCAWIDEPGGTLTLWAPLSGRLVDLNPVLEPHPETTTLQPYGDGWILRIAPSDFETERRHFETPAAWRESTRHDREVWTQQVLRAAHRADPKIGLVLQDGGEPVQSLDALLGPALRRALALPFLDHGRTRR